MSANVSESVDVAKSAEDVFAALTDWSGQGDWMFATSVRPTRGYGRQDGDEITARTGVGPIGFTDTMTITEWDPPLDATDLSALTAARWVAECLAGYEMR